MKKVHYLFILSLILVFIASCGTQKSATELAEEKRILIEK